VTCVVPGFTFFYVYEKFIRDRCRTGPGLFGSAPWLLAGPYVPELGFVLPPPDAPAWEAMLYIRVSRLIELPWDSHVTT